jgi:hypothetical protein
LRDYRIIWGDALYPWGDQWGGAKCNLALGPDSQPSLWSSSRGGRRFISLVGNVGEYLGGHSLDGCKAEYLGPSVLTSRASVMNMVSFDPEEHLNLAWSRSSPMAFVGLRYIIRIPDSL